METDPPTKGLPQGLSRPAALLITFLGILFAVYIGSPSVALINKYKYGNRLPFQSPVTTALPQSAPEAALTKHVLSHLTPSQLSSRERTVADIASTPATRTRLLSTLASLHLYSNRALGALTKKKKAFAKMVRQDSLLLQQAGVDYMAKLAYSEKRVKHTAKVVEQILEHACAYYGVARKEVEAYAKATESGSTMDHTHLTHALKHFVRDFSTEGVGERKRTFGLIQGWVAQEFPEGEREGVKILVPGCGVGGLLWEIASMGFQATGVEWSFWMNIMQHFVTDAGPVPIVNTELETDWKEHKGQHTIYPYIDWWSHHATNANMTRAIIFPHPTAPLPPAIPPPSSSYKAHPLPASHPANRVFLREGDFTTIHEPFSPPQYACIVTLFFLDTAQSIPTYLRKIDDYLLPGGVWINVGPFLYGTKPVVEMSLEEVVKVAEGMGFSFDNIVQKMRKEGPAAGWVEGSGDYNGWVDTLGNGKVAGFRAGYNIDWKGMGRNDYLAQSWIARKKK